MEWEREHQWHGWSAVPRGSGWLTYHSGEPERRHRGQFCCYHYSREFWGFLAAELDPLPFWKYVNYIHFTLFPACLVEEFMFGWKTWGRFHVFLSCSIHSKDFFCVVSFLCWTNTAYAAASWTPCLYLNDLDVGWGIFDLPQILMPMPPGTHVTSSVLDLGNYSTVIIDLPSADSTVLLKVLEDSWDRCKHDNIKTLFKQPPFSFY